MCRREEVSCCGLWVVGNVSGQEERFFLSYNVVLGSKLGMPWKGSGSSCFEDKAQEIVE
jgi:hypothetical protein